MDAKPKPVAPCPGCGRPMTVNHERRCDYRAICWSTECPWEHIEGPSRRTAREALEAAQFCRLASPREQRLVEALTDLVERAELLIENTPEFDDGSPWVRLAANARAALATDREGEGGTDAQT